MIGRYNPHMLPKVQSEQLCNSIRSLEMPCTLRIANFVGLVCDGHAVEGHHLPVFGKGMGTKVSDIYQGAACRVCHDVAHSKTGAELRVKYPNAYTERLWFAMAETQGLWLQGGLIGINTNDVRIIG
jgi:hypothetical protein